MHTTPISKGGIFYERATGNPEKALGYFDWDWVEADASYQRRSPWSPERAPLPGALLSCLAPWVDFEGRQWHERPMFSAFHRASQD